jgi:hypothetical protein
LRRDFAFSLLASLATWEVWIPVLWKGGRTEGV